MKHAMLNNLFICNARRGTAAALAAAFLIAGCAGPQKAAMTTPVARLVVLGDSNVDNGNLLRMTRNEVPPAPNWQGRNSNGPNVVEYLAKSLNAKLDNYAVSGADTGSGNVVAKISPPHAYVEKSGVAVQLQDLVASNARFGPGDLVVLWAGSNDIFGVKRAERSALDQRIATAAVNIESTIAKLHSMGAQRFLVANRTPREALGTENDLNGIDLNNAVSVAVMQARAKTGADVRLYDAYSAIADMMKNPSKYGFKEPNALCWSVPACANDSFEKGLSVGSTYVNWDAAHKTTRVHQLMAEQIAQMVKN